MSAENCICCTNPFNMGCLVSCNVVTLPMVAPAPDLYTILIEYNGSVIKIERNYLLGENITINPGEYNEGYEHTVKVYDSNGTLITYEVSPTEIYDCAIFKSNPYMNGTPVPVNSEPLIDPV